jgi:methionyl-tRNA formyltransferase
MTEQNFIPPESVRRADVLLLGDGPTALAALRSLVASCRVVGVIRATVEAEVDPVRVFAEQNKISVSALQRAEDLPNMITWDRPTAVVISSFNRILPPDVLNLSRFINVHFSPLPRYRGRANVNWAVVNGERTAAITIHMVTSELDSGNILFQEEIPVEPGDTATSLYDRLNAIQERELGFAVIRAVAGDVGVPQDHRKATYGCARIPDDGEIIWGLPTAVITQLIRALTPPFPGAFTHLESRRLIIARAAPCPDAPAYAGRVPGRVVGRSPAWGWVDVLTGDGVLRIFEVMSTAGIISPAARHIRSTRVTLGLSRLDLLRRINALEERVAMLEERL